MKILSKSVFLMLLGIMATGLAGCASMKALSSTPPVKAIVLEKSAEFRFGLGSKISLPAGEYKPVMEDDHGYFYQAPSKLVARDIFSYVADGGVFVKRGEKAPSLWYAIDEHNYTKTGRLPEHFEFKVVE